MKIQKSFSIFSSASWDFNPRRTRLPPPNMVVMKPSLTAERERPLVENSIKKSFGSPRTLTITRSSMPTPRCGLAEIVYSDATRSFVILKPLPLKKSSTSSLSSAKPTFFPVHRSCIFETPEHTNLLSASPLNVLSQGTGVQTKRIDKKLILLVFLKLN